MLSPSRRKTKGRKLEKEVANALHIFDKTAFAKLDSGSSNDHKEDVVTQLNFFIECKNQRSLHVNKWWSVLLTKVPIDKIPLLVYRKSHARTPRTVIRLCDLIVLLNYEGFLSNTLIDIDFYDFIGILKVNSDIKLFKF